MDVRDRSVGLKDSDFPERALGCEKVPDHLFVRARGTVPRSERMIAIVGSRAASGHAMAYARSLASSLAADGAVIVSGGAIGIDTAAHRGALDADGKTIVVLGCGLDMPYPARNRPLFDEVVTSGGALISAYRHGTPPRRFHFVERNRLVASMVDAVVVACAQLGSGALHTASFAAEYGRVVAALPGTPGCEQLIARGAAVVENKDDLYAALSGSPRRPEVLWPIAGTDEGVVLDCLDAAHPRAEVEIVNETGLEATAVRRVLTGLELEGLALALPDGAFIRSSLAVEVSSAPRV